MEKPHGQWDLKEHNLKIVLNEIRHNEPISRSELSKRTGLSAASLTRIVSRLSRMDLINERNSSKTGEKGRLSTLISINPTAFYTVCVFIDKSEVCVGLMDFKRNIIGKLSEAPYFRAATAKGILEQAYNLYVRLVREHEIQKIQIQYIGICCTGAVSREQSTILFCPDFCWTDEQISEICKDIFKLPCVLENDAKAALIGEKEQNFYGCNNFSYLKINGEFECASLCDDNLLLGEKNLAGSLGHINSGFDNGYACSCGRLGCLNTFISDTVLVKLAKKSQKEVLNLDDVMAAYKLQYDWANEIAENAAKAVSIALNVCVCMYNPKIIAVGGLFAWRYPFIIENAIRIYEKSSYKALSKDTIVVSAKEEGLTGIGILALEYALEKLYKVYI